MKILLDDDDQGILDYLQEVFDDQPDMQIVAVVTDGVAAVEEILANNIDIAILDVQMPGMTGIEVAREIQARNLPVTVVILTAYDRQDYILEALRAGASGFLKKDALADEMREQIRSVHRGGTVFGSGPATILANSFVRQARAEQIDPGFSRVVKSLSRRQVEVLDRLILAKSNAEIASELRLSIGTVKGYVSALMDALGCRNRSDIVIQALRAGYAPTKTRRK